jgi:hypothetical protein
LSQIDPDDQVDITDIAPGVTTGEYAGMLRNSFFVSLYSFFESKLISECRSRKNEGVLLDFDDIRAPDEIERVKKYFTKVLRIDFPSKSHEWQTIHDYHRIIRNCIVHTQGRITELKEKDREKLQRYIAKDNNIVLFGKDEKLYLKKEFCEDACKTIETFLMMVLFPEEAE